MYTKNNPSTCEKKNWSKRKTGEKKQQTETRSLRKIGWKEKLETSCIFFIRGIDSIKSVAVAHAPGVVEWVDWFVSRVYSVRRMHNGTRTTGLLSRMYMFLLIHVLHVFIGSGAGKIDGKKEWWAYKNKSNRSAKKGWRSGALFL